LNAVHSLRQRGTLYNRASFFAQPGEKRRTKEEKYRSAEGVQARDRVTPVSQSNAEKL
jgi:hypothetical protein